MRTIDYLAHIQLHVIEAFQPDAGVYVTNSFSRWYRHEGLMEAFEESGIEFSVVQIKNVPELDRGTHNRYPNAIKLKLPEVAKNQNAEATASFKKVARLLKRIEATPGDPVVVMQYAFPVSVAFVT